MKIQRDFSSRIEWRIPMMWGKYKLLLNVFSRQCLRRIFDVSWPWKTLDKSEDLRRIFLTLNFNSKHINFYHFPKTSLKNLLRKSIICVVKIFFEFVRSSKINAISDAKTVVVKNLYLTSQLTHYGLFFDQSPLSQFLTRKTDLCQIRLIIYIK